MSHVLIGMTTHTKPLDIEPTLVIRMMRLNGTLSTTPLATSGPN
jgi:hypothetical protein